MRDEIIRCNKGEYFVHLWETKDGRIFASDLYSERDKDEPAQFDSWDEALVRARECVHDNEGTYLSELPITPLCSDDADVCRYSVAELNETAETRLRELLASNSDFDTGWGASTKELESVRFYAREGDLTVSVFMEMDDMPELIFDALPDGAEMSDEAFGEIRALCDEVGITTEIKVDETVARSSSYEDIMLVVKRLRDDANSFLKEQFELCKSCVRDCLRS